MQSCLRTSLERRKTEIFKPRIADRIALGNSVASAFFFFLSPISASGEGNDFPGEVGSAVLRLGWDCSSENDIRVLVTFQPHPGNECQELQLGAKQPQVGSRAAAPEFVEQGWSKPRQLSKDSSRENPTDKVQRVSEMTQVWMEWPGLSARKAHQEYFWLFAKLKKSASTGGLVLMEPADSGKSSWKNAF